MRRPARDRCARAARSSGCSCPPSSAVAGCSRIVLTGLEEHARSLGWTRLLLETGDQQPEAIGLYTSAGYERIPNFGHYADSDISLCFAKDL